MYKPEVPDKNSEFPQPEKASPARTAAESILQRLEQASKGLLAHMGPIPTLTLIGGTMVIGDALLDSWRPNSIPAHNWALLDSPIHALLALLVVSPLFKHSFFQRNLLGWIAVAGLSATLIDLDHIVAARSFSLVEITQLPARPGTHTLLFALGCSLVALLLTRRRLVGWLIFAVLASHVLRDASTGATYFLWPLPFDQLPIPAYYAAQILLYLLSYFFAAKRLDRKALRTR
jgi:hypothetical protein